MATLTVNISEEVFLNGANRGSNNVLAITGVNEVYHRILSLGPVSISPSDLLTTDSLPEGSVVSPSAIRYIRVTNLSDSSSPAIMHLKVQTANSEFISVLGYGETFLMTDSQCYAGTGVDQAYTLADMKSIKAGASGSSCLAEVFVATT